jgi:hypothetical protein
VCHDTEQAAAPRPALVSWKCKACSSTKHRLVIHIQTKGRADFARQAGDDFGVERWPDAFGWFDLDTSCVACGKLSELVSYETM